MPMLVFVNVTVWYYFHDSVFAEAREYISAKLIKYIGLANIFNFYDCLWGSKVLQRIPLNRLRKDCDLSKS